MPQNGGHPESALDALVVVLLAAAARGCVAVLPSPGSWVGSPPVCEFPECVEAGLQIRPQPEGVEPLILGGERGGAFWGEDAARHQPTVGCLRAIVPFDHPRAMAFL